MEGVLQHDHVHKPLKRSLQVSCRQKKEHYTNNYAEENGWITNLNETLKYMLEQFAPEGNYNDESDTHKQARILSQELVDTEDDKDFTVGEIRNAVASMLNKKAPGQDGITCEI